jgi:TonB family protein
MAVHQELGNEQFIGALYSETLSDNADTLISSNLPIRMELKIVTPDGMATRRFSRMWIEGMAINNSSSLLTAQADNMVKFDGLFKGWLRERDHIVFALTPGSGIDIRVNNVLLGNIEDDRFFEMLLRTWVGRVPLSSTYRENLLKVGNVPAALRSRYDSISFDQARVAEVTAWIQPAVEEPAPVTAAVAVAARPQPRPTPTPAPSEIASTQALPAPRLELPVLTQPTANTPAERQPEPTPEPAVVAAATPPTPEEEDEEENLPALTAQSLLARQFYVSDILKRINGNTQYPRRAQERNQEGGTRIAVTIDRSGNIQNMSWLEESKHSLLNKAAWGAVERSAPFPTMPEALAGQRFEFTVPISFEMQ